MPQMANAFLTPGLLGRRAMSSPPVVQLFYNPASGSFAPARIERLARAFAALGARVLKSPSVSEPPVIAHEATHACIAGGDGTVRHVAMAIARSGRKLPAAIWPAGTVNLLAREGPDCASPERLAADLLGESDRREHWPVRLGETMFLACASVGPDARAVAGVSGALKRRIGRLAYAVSFLSLLRRWPRSSLTVKADGRTLACEAVFVAKGRHYAGPWSFAPRASVSDGVLHVIALHRARRRDFARFLVDLALGRDPARRSGVTALVTRSLSIDGSEPLPVQADGDVVASLPVRLAVAERPLHFR